MKRFVEKTVPSGVAPERLFELPKLPDVQAPILVELARLECTASPQNVLRIAAFACIRECQKVVVESRVRKIAGAAFNTISDAERTAADLAYLACLS